MIRARENETKYIIYECVAILTVAAWIAWALVKVIVGGA